MTELGRETRDEYRFLSGGPAAFELYGRRATLKEVEEVLQWDGSGMIVVEKRTVETTRTPWERVDV